MTRLSAFAALAATITSSAVLAAAEPVYVGCFHDVQADRLLGDQGTPNPLPVLEDGAMTLEVSSRAVELHVVHVNSLFGLQRPQRSRLLSVAGPPRQRFTIDFFGGRAKLASGLTNHVDPAT